MAITFDLLKDKVNKYLRNSDLSDISKNDFRNYVALEQSTIKSLCESLEKLDASEKKYLSELILEKVKNRSSMNIQIYNIFLSRLSGQAQKDERNGAFSSIVTAARNYMTILDEIDRNIDKLFENKVISVYNIKVSHMAIVGVLKNVNTLYNFGLFLFNGVCYDVGLGIDKPARYRFSFINDTKENVAVLVNNMYNGVGDGAIFNEILNLRKENKDVLVVDDNNEINGGMLSIASLNRSMTASITAGLMSLNIFRWIGETWNNFRDSHYRALEEKRDWMESHVQMLRLKLQGMDAEDREYQKLQKIINNYDNMVAAADEKIKKYRESE